MTQCVKVLTVMPVVPSLILMAPTLNKKNNSGKNKKQIKNKKINKKKIGNALH